ncbi:Exocyst complex component 3 [Schistosoma japonicum]|nr:Exocyst complex component 3 [Schistosoma japonicum]
MSVQSLRLSELEEKARANALKKVSDHFQKPEQLDKIDIIKSRFLNQKTATEAQLKMALYSQLDGSKVGLEKLDTALAESQTCRNRLIQLGSSLSSLTGLSQQLHELKNLSTKYSQLGAAMENMNYLVKAPETFEQARTYLESENLLEGHKLIQELEGIRDELMYEVYKEKSMDDLDTLRAFFRELENLNEMIRQKIIMLGSRLTSAVITHNRFVVNCVRIIDREERTDANWRKRSEKHGFMPNGRPKQWKKLLFDSIFNTIKNKVFGSALDSENDKNKLVRHNEVIRQHTLADLKIAKNICPTYFPADYAIFDRFVEMYHEAIGMHDWQRSTGPELDGSSYYFTDLPVLVMTPINEMIGKGNLLHYLGNAVREQFFTQCVEEMTLFVKDYDDDIKKYRAAYVQDRSKFPCYIEYILANANGACMIAHSFVTVIMDELTEDSHLRGNLSARISHLKTEYEKVAEQWITYAEETVFMDLNRVLAVIMTSQLRPDDITTQYLVGTLADYDETLKHMRQNLYDKLAEKLAERMLIEYLKALISRRSPLSTEMDRRKAGEKITQDGHDLKNYFEEKMKVKSEVVVAYDALTIIGQLFLTTDTSMLPLDIAVLKRQFPDVRPDQVYALLVARGDVSSDNAKVLSADSHYGKEITQKSSPFTIFTRLVVAMDKKRQHEFE